MIDFLNDPQVLYGLRWGFGFWMATASATTAAFVMGMGMILIAKIFLDEYGG